MSSMGWLTAFRGSASIALVEDGTWLRLRQKDKRNSGLGLWLRIRGYGREKMRIAITMCHGIRPTGSGMTPHPLAAEHLDRLMKIAAEMGFTSIDYDDLEAWREGSATLPEHPIMIDFDHPVRSMRYEVSSGTVDAI